MAKQDYEIKIIRDVAILTNSYVATDIRWFNDNLDLTGKNQVVLLLDFTVGSLTSLDMQIEFSSDNKDYYQETSIEIVWWIWIVSLFEYTFTETWKYRLSFPIKDKFMRVKAKGTWTGTGSSLKITSITWLS